MQIAIAYMLGYLYHSAMSMDNGSMVIGKDTNQKDQGVFYPRAVGFVRGVVVLDESNSNGVITLESGCILPCSVAFRPAVSHLKTGENQILKVFPQSYQDAGLKLKIAAVITKDREQLNHFHIIGTLRKVFDDSAIMSVWSAHKRRLFKVQVFGKLDAGCEKGELYELSCRLEDTRLILVESKKLADSFSPATETGKPQPAKSVKQVEDKAVIAKPVAMEMMSL